MYRTDLIVRQDAPYQRLEDTFGGRAGYTVAHSHSGFNAFRHHLLGYRSAERPVLYREMLGNLITARNILDSVRDGRIDVGPLDAYWHALMARHAPAARIAGVRVLASTAHRADARPGRGRERAAKPPWSGCVPRCWVRPSRPWFARFADVLELEGFAAVSQDTYSVLLDWEREARAAGYDQPRLIASNAAGRVLQGIVRPKQEAARHVKVRHVDQSAVLCDQPLANPPIARRVAIPGNARRFVMERVQVVEQEQRTQHPGTLDDRDALAHAGARAMFGEGANQHDRVGGQDHRQQIDPQRHAAHELQPQHHRHAPQQVLDPYRAQVRLVLRAAIATRGEKNRPMVHAEPTIIRPASGLLDPQQRAGRRAQLQPAPQASSNRIPDRRPDR